LIQLTPLLEYRLNNFYEYKIYRHYHTGLDENTGTLIHVSTSADDTIFNDIGTDLEYGLTPATTYYYRVYINNNFGRLGGSNIIGVTTNKWENENNFTVFLDGFGVYAALKFLGYNNIEKFNATDLYNKIFEEFSFRRTRLFLIGSNFSDKFASEKARKKRLNLCGYHNGYFSNDEIVSILDAINNTAPEVVIIGMGVPKQEFIAVEMAQLIQNKVILCVGGFLEFYFGTKKRAPGFLRKIGFEWLHRLFSEPKKMWKRYIIGIPLFIFQIAKLKFSFLGKTTKDNSTLK